ncbi:MAG: FAD-dependent oxidoreductase [Deltaproteobacteria bacterium]|nr:FAD-dependent oxidoreductase [Deltaproteobacteria bacterium]
MIVIEAASHLKVCRTADVIVVGGGPAGVAAAVASARNGADTVLIERYGHLGGLATGGLVLLIMPMSDAAGKQHIGGLCQEIIDRLDTFGASVHPRYEDLGSDDSELVGYWLSRGCRFFASEGRVTLNALFDPEMLKCVLNEMVEEAGVKLFLHSLGARAVVEDDSMQGVIFESKSGRQALLGKVIVDATGDGDIFASAEAAYDSNTDWKLRSSKLALVFRVGNVDFVRFAAFRQSRQDEYNMLMSEIETLGGFSMWLPAWTESVVWFNNYIPGLNGLSVEDLTWVEINARKKMLLTHDFFSRRVPGFENSFIIDTASQVGVRVTRRLIGEHIVTEEEMQAGILHEDTIAVIPARQWDHSIAEPLVYIPYRSLLPHKVENLLAAGRCFSSDRVANDILSPIQCCIAMGQAAGTSAALAAARGISPRMVDHRALQERLSAQNVPLPDRLKPHIQTV